MSDDPPRMMFNFDPINGRASKAALNIINKSLVTDLAEKNVQCVLMHPGYVSTDMTSVWPSV